MGASVVGSSVPRRKRLRLAGYDYASTGLYFVTICTARRQPTLATIVGDEVRLTQTGETVHAEWLRLPLRFRSVALDTFVIMPDHIHGIIVLGSQEMGYGGVSDVIDAPSLGKVVRTFKAASSSSVRKHGQRDFAWQRGYYDHIIRSDDDLDSIRTYVEGNPGEWALDAEDSHGGAIRAADLGARRAR